MPAGDRWRMVYWQDGTRSVSSIVLSAEEARESLEIEQFLLEASGWDILVRSGSRLICQKQSERLGRLVEREIVIERYAPESDTEVST